ncbi:hypothetical protein [Amycolatopsis sp. NPDC051371]|uniref:hypothetical protein n=1 Tax=Amycolatopsis sp. NPDC051371 TaxID=3155800 RepID=UPI0034122055
MVIRVLGAILLLALAAFGGILTLAGIGEQHAVDTTYVADFGRSGEECGSGPMHFDESDGEVLTCLPGGSSAGFPGFSDEQNGEIETLAKQLGADTLSEADQARVQQRVDDFAATVPDSARPRYDEGFTFVPLRGTWLAVAGGVLVVGSLLGFRFLLRR